MEASVYALLASYQNLGSSVARSVGVALIDFLHINTEKCEFRGLPMAIFIAHVALPLLVVPLVFILIPDAKMTDDLLTDEQRNGVVENDWAELSGWSESDTSDDDKMELANPDQDVSSLDE